MAPIRLFVNISWILLPTVMFGGYSLLYYQYLGHTSSSVLVRWMACTAVVVGLLAIAGGFFLHKAREEPGRGSAAVLVTNLRAGLLALATLFLASLINVG